MESEYGKIALNLMHINKKAHDDSSKLSKPFQPLLSPFLGFAEMAKLRKCYDTL